MPVLIDDIPTKNKDELVDHIKSTLSVKGNRVAPNIIHAVDDYGHHTYGKVDDKGHFKSVHSMYKDNHQRFVAKVGTGNIHDVMDVMKHHIKKYGVIKSDGEQTKGGKALWKRLITSKDPSFKVSVERDGKHTRLDHTNIQDHEDKIWGDAGGAFHTLHATRTED